MVAFLCDKKLFYWIRRKSLGRKYERLFLFPSANKKEGLIYRHILPATAGGIFFFSLLVLFQMHSSFPYGKVPLMGKETNRT